MPTPYIVFILSLMPSKYPNMPADIDALLSDESTMTGLRNEIEFCATQATSTIKDNPKHWKKHYGIVTNNEELSRIGKEVFSHFPELMIQRDPMMESARNSLEQQAEEVQRCLACHIIVYAAEAIDVQLGQQDQETFCPLSPSNIMSTFRNGEGSSWTPKSKSLAWMEDLGLLDEAEKRLTAKGSRSFVLGFYYEGKESNPSASEIAYGWEQTHWGKQLRSDNYPQGWKEMWKQCQQYIPENSMVSQDEDLKNEVLEVFKHRAGGVVARTALFCVSSHLLHIMDEQTAPMDWESAAYDGFIREFKRTPLGELFGSALALASTR